MNNDIRDVSEALSSHHPFVGVFPDQMTLVIDESPEVQGWCNEINDLRNGVTDVSWYGGAGTRVRDSN